MGTTMIGSGLGNTGTHRIELCLLIRRAHAMACGLHDTTHDERVEQRMLSKYKEFYV